MDPHARCRPQEPTLNADPASQLVLLDVQAHDSVIAQLTHRRTSLPELARITELSGQESELDGRRVEAATAVEDLQRAQKKADQEVEQVKTRRARDEERLASGAIRNPKDLESLQHELTALQRRISTLEDEELEVMEDLEQAQATLIDVNADLEALRTDLRQVEAARDAAVQAIDAELTTNRAEREAVVAAVPDDLLALYEKLRAQHGIGAAALRARRCEGCRLEINAADLRDVASRPADEVVRCPECSRILVRTAESGL